MPDCTLTILTRLLVARRICESSRTGDGVGRFLRMIRAKSRPGGRQASLTSRAATGNQKATRKVACEDHETRGEGSTSEPCAPFIFAFLPGMCSRYLQTTPPRLYRTTRRNSSVSGGGMTGYRLPLSPSILFLFKFIYFPVPLFSLAKQIRLICVPDS